MTVNQMDVLAGVILNNWYMGVAPEFMTYKELAQCYERIRKNLSYWNEVQNDEGRVEDGHTE